MSTFYELFNAQGGGKEEALALSGPIGRKNQAFNTVNNRMEFLEDVAKAALMQTSSFIEDLQALVRSLEAPDASDIEVEDAELPAIDYNSRPDLGSLDLDLTMPEPPAALALNPIDDQMEDVDFGRRLCAAGGIVVPLGIPVRHLSMRGAEVSRARRMKLLNGNRIRFARKHYGLLFSLFLRMVWAGANMRNR